MRDAFHQVAVADYREDARIEEPAAIALEARLQMLCGNRHPNPGREALSERTGGGLDSRCAEILRMAGRHALQLTEALDLLHRQVVAIQIKQRVQQRRSVSCG